MATERIQIENELRERAATAGRGRGGDQSPLRRGLRHRHRNRDAAAGPGRRRRARDLGAQERARMDDRVAPQGVPALADDDAAALGEAPHRADRFPGDQLFLGAEEPAEIARRGRSEAARNLRQARRAAARARASRRRRGRCGVRFGLGRHDVPQGARRSRRDLLLDLRGDPRASGSRAEISRQRRADHRQLSSRR